VFGLTSSDGLNLNELDKDGRFCGNEHCIELVWTTKSRDKGKVYWNNRCVGNLNRRRSCDHKQAQLSWKTICGTSIVLLAKMGLENKDDRNQCLLFVGGLNFFSLPMLRSVRQNSGKLPLSMTLARTDAMESRECSDSELRPNMIERECKLACEVSSVSESSLSPKVDAVLSAPGNSLSFRLGLVGLDSSTSKFQYNDVVMDELHSDLYSPVLESLRRNIQYYLPQAEQDVSLAITNAFFTDASSLLSIDSPAQNTLPLMDAFQLETNYIWKALSTMRERKSKFDADTCSRFLRSCIEDVVLCIRNEQLTSEEATRVILSIASVLNLDFAHAFRKSSVTFEDPETPMFLENAQRSFSCFGEVEDVVLCSNTPHFGLCRFAQQETIAQVQHASSKGEFRVGAARPTICVL
jgi:hypothetical protein